MQEPLKKQHSNLCTAIRNLTYPAIFFFAMDALVVIALLIAAGVAGTQNTNSEAFLPTLIPVVIGLIFLGCSCFYLPANRAYKKACHDKTNTIKITPKKVRFIRMLFAGRAVHNLGVRIWFEVDGELKLFYYIFPKIVHISYWQVKEIFRGELDITYYAGTHAIAYIKQIRDDDQIRSVVEDI